MEKKKDLPSSEAYDISDPKNPQNAQWKQLQAVKKQRDENVDKLLDQAKKLVDDSIKIADNIDKINKGTLAGPQKYEDQKAAIEKVSRAQLDLLEAQTKACIDAFTKQTDDLNSDLLKQKELVSKILNDINSEVTKETLLDDDNKLRDTENISFSDKQDENNDFTNNLSVTLLKQKLDISDKNLKSESSHDMFVRKYITPNYVKKNLYEFINQCILLDSVPSWRAKITTLMVGYLTNYVVDPNDKTKHISVIPSYDYFNLVLQGTPGVGKSYSSAIIGKALKWCGFLTVGKMKEIKKPDIVGSYTGQTAPKVYNELTQGLGNIVFIDEAYSIAGAKDETKGTFNEFGQEALDAITDYTSEHIGLLAFIVAGYEYEMQNQFLNVNIGLPRRFPTVLTLRRYDMKSFWKILEMPIIKFCPRYQVDHQHHACFELLNIMFNFQWTPNPVLQISKNWASWWEGYNLKNLIMNLKVNMITNGEEIINIPFLKLSNFDKKINNIENTNITATSIDVLPLTELIGGDINMETATFIKAYFIYKFCNIRNGDFFRSQADNLTKFGQTILSDKIINPSKLFVPDEDKNKNGNTKWIEYIYFNLYFTENPNKKVKNITFSFETPNETKGGSSGHEDLYYQHNGGSKIRQYTKKNIKSKKYTRKNNSKNKKKTIHKRVGRKNKKTIRQRGGDLESDLKILMNYYLNKSIEKQEMLRSAQSVFDYIKANTEKTKELRNIYDLIDKKFNQLRTFDYDGINPQDKKLYKEKLNFIKKKIQELANPPVDSINQTEEKKTELENNSNQESSSITEQTNDDEMLKNPNPTEEDKERISLDLKEKLNLKENIPSQKEYMNMTKEEKRQFEYKQQEAIKKKQLSDQQIAQTESNMKNLVGEIKKGDLSNLKNINKDLVFDIVGIDFSEFRDTQEITETIVRNKIIDNEINKKESANEKLKTIFVTFMNKYNEYLTIFSNNTEMDVKQKSDLPIFIYTYLLLTCYNTAFIESKKPLTKFNNDSWWFFTAQDFKIIANYLDIEIIIDNFNKSIGVEPEIKPENKDIEKVEKVAQEVAEDVEKAEVKKDVKDIEEGVDESK